MDLLNERQNIEEILAKKDLFVTIKIPISTLENIKTEVEHANNGKIEDLELFATDLVMNIIERFGNIENINPEDFQDLVVREDIGRFQEDETTLATSGTPTPNDPGPRKLKEDK